jgi:hypothetical protein
MLDFIFRKKPTILLLLAIIVISLIFSLLLNQPLHEGFEATINNPPPTIVTKCYEIIQDKNKDKDTDMEKTKLQKLSEIRALVNNKYKVLSDIYSENEKSILKELTTALDGPVKKNADGKPLDANALDGDARENARKVLSSDNYNGMEKIEKIDEILKKSAVPVSASSTDAETAKNTDKAITNIMNDYVGEWFRTVKENIMKLNTTKNDVVNPTSSP